LIAGLGAAVTALWGGPSSGQSVRSDRDRAEFTCVVTPDQTEGPYFVDEHLNRSDIRSDPSDGSVRPGVPLNLLINVAAIAECRPLAGAIVDIWHCDASGVYSDVIERRFKTPGSRFLRGYQVTDQSGSVRFATIYPGSYPGRAVHIHFKIRANSKGAQAVELTSQLYFDDAITDQVHSHAPYPQRPRPRTRNEQDGIFQDGGRSLMLPLSASADGYDARFKVGLKWPS
jgi:protocatechuate 3,4-dioxygenase beta subunit